MKVLLFGANSYVGARIYFDLKSSYTVTGTYAHNQLSKDFIQLDIIKKDQVDALVSRIKPDIIIHAANNASSKWVDTHPQEAVALNQTATQSIVDAANANGSKLIYISTLGAVDATNLYGKTKAESEKMVIQTKAGYLILRPSLILGYSPNTTNDRPFNRLLRNIDLGEAAAYDTSWKFQPTYIGQISEVIKVCIDRGIWNQIISVAVPEMKSRYDTAKDILSRFGVNVTPIDLQDKTFSPMSTGLFELLNLNLPSITYDQMIGKIITEIQNREKFVI